MSYGNPEDIEPGDQSEPEDYVDAPYEIVLNSEITPSRYMPVSFDDLDVKAFANIIVDCGEVRELVITRDSFIVDGEHWFAGAKLAGLKDVVCRRLAIDRKHPKFLALMYKTTRERVEFHEELPREEGLSGNDWPTYLHADAKAAANAETLRRYIGRIIEPLLTFWPLHVLEVYQLLNELRPIHGSREEQRSNEEVTYLALANFLRSAVEAGTLPRRAIENSMGGIN